MERSHQMAQRKMSVLSRQHTNVSVLKKHHKEALLDLDFDPGDRLVVKMYLEQMKVHDMMKDRFVRKKKIFGYINKIAENLVGKFDQEMKYVKACPEDLQSRQNFIDRAMNLTKKNEESQEDI